MVAMTTSHSLWKFYLKALIVTVAALSQNKILFSNKHVSYVSVSFYSINYSFDAVAFSAFYRLYLEITLFCTKPSQQLIYCHVTKAKMLGVF